MVMKVAILHDGLYEIPRFQPSRSYYAFAYQVFLGNVYNSFLKTVVINYALATCCSNEIYCTKARVLVIVR